MKRAISRLHQPTAVNHEPTKVSEINDVELCSAYNKRVETIREIEYPTLVGATYLDHAGTTPYAKSAIESWTRELTTNLFGNPHSASASSQLSTRRTDDIRLKVLKFFNADPEDFDIVFVANATAAVKLVVEAFRDQSCGFWYGYHSDSHTSLVGCRELATKGSRCFEDDQSLRQWISAIPHQDEEDDYPSLISYPGQSNLTGRKLPLNWSGKIRRNAARCSKQIYTLLDAASLASTSPLDLSDTATAPDFVALSFYKIFGFPDLGALLVRKESAAVLLQKRYFAGGTVDVVVSIDEPWHAKKGILHAALEEGTLPFHNILALDHAMAAHTRLFRSMTDVSRHARYLAEQARGFLGRARHANGVPASEVYGDSDSENIGPIVAFNLKDSSGKFISASEVEKLSIVKGIQLRTGGMCNPGGIAKHLSLSGRQIRSNYGAGYRCGGESDLINGQPVGAVRISFGAMSTRSDLENFKAFIDEYYIEHNVLQMFTSIPDLQPQSTSFFIDSISVFPIKSCAAFKIPPDQQWLVTPKGLAWDREWCLVHEGTNAALSQKRYPRLSLLRPSLDLVRHKLVVSYISPGTNNQIEIDIDEIPQAVISAARTCSNDAFRLSKSKLCGDTIPVHVYTSPSITKFFSDVLDVPCCLARYLRTGTTRSTNIRQPRSSKSSSRSISKQPTPPSQLMLANESPILIISKSSVNELDKQVRDNALAKGLHKGTIRPITPDLFRGNVVVAQHPSSSPDSNESPYCEDTWTSVTIHPAHTSTSSPTTTTTTITGQPSQPSSRSISPVPSLLSLPSLPSSTNTTPEATPSMPGSFTTTTDHQITTPIPSSCPPPPSSPSPALQPSPSLIPTETKPTTLSVLGPCQRCQMISINQSTGESQSEPYSTLVKTRRKGDGRVWFGVHAALASNGMSREGEEGGTGGGDGDGEVFVRIGDLVIPAY